MTDPSANWPRFIGEGIAIVVSILLAFAIDAWWDERALRIEEQQVLRDLQDEFRSNRDVLARHLQEHRQELETIRTFLASDLSVDNEATGPLVDSVLIELLRPRTTDLGGGTLKALLSSGRIEILSDRQLRARLAAWDGVISEVWDDQATRAGLVFELHIPYLAKEEIPAARAMHLWYEDWPLPRQSPSEDPVLLERILGDETLRLFVETMFGYMLHTTEEFEAAIAAADAILADIDSSIR